MASTLGAELLSASHAKRCLVPIPLKLTRFSPLEFLSVSQSQFLTTATVRL